MKTTMKKIAKAGFVIKPHAVGVDGILRDLMEYFERRGVRCLLEKAAAEKIGVKGGMTRERIPAASDLVVVVGGDGTLLSIAHLAAQSGVPVMGINMGRLGFLTEIPAEEAVLTLDSLLGGNREIISPRWLFEARVGRRKSYCLNDAVITKGALARMIDFTIAVDGETVARLKSDGLIISTPTGSTAYSLSAGGPIVHPGLQATVITPICPHTFTFRPLLIPSDSRVSVRLLTAGEEVHYTLDGQRGDVMVQGDVLDVRRAPLELLLVTSPKRNYFDMVKEKLGWGNS